MFNRLGKIIAIAAFAAALVLASGCTAAVQHGQETPAQKHRGFMSQVNSYMDDFGKNMETFSEAVAKNDIVAIKMASEKAFKIQDQINSIDAPDDLSDVKQKYCDGIKKVEEALSDYIKLYSDSTTPSFDQTTYNERIEAIQKKYNEGADLLKEGDETAASKN